ncbi:OmpA family protein [Thalassococcus sp. CAU 1522]|uniref:OmpA family protein n=1 Tax=Thalassococcus arenae TaxID=2851652 RepID=A0ABS6N4P3_9RHOB|nr:OmpA family protein [Thalassococcus arenae]MBV2358971.1 OmpA family protein [Thalassococcus arenae]
MPNTTRSRARALALLAALALPAALPALTLPDGAARTAQQVGDPGRYPLPTGPWTLDAGLPVQVVEGRVVREAWRIDGTGLTPSQIIVPLRDELAAQGFEIVLDCAASDCGGFDFRFGTEVLQAPAMLVDLTAFRFVSARRGDGAVVSLLASRTGNAGYLQVVRAGFGSGDGFQVGTGAPRLVATQPAAAAPQPPGSLTERLETQGHVVLSDLDFASGSADLARETYASLDELAAYLRGNPDRTVVFVGHTDATGSLAANQALSTRRAQSVVAYMRARDVPAAQVSADGVGYLSPRATNLTQEGRDTNRRVEAVLLSTE